MTLKELRANLEALEKLDHMISTKVKALYEKRNKLSSLCIEEISKRKEVKLCDLLADGLNIKFRDGEKWKVSPMFSKNSELRNVIWKVQGVPAFVVERES